MSVFRDKFEKQWNLELTLERAWKIEEYDFAGRTEKVKLVPPSDDLIPKRITDSTVVFGMVWILAQDQIHEFNQTLPQLEKQRQAENDKLPADQRKSHYDIQRIGNELDFARRFDGPAVTRMKQALWEELANFFPEGKTTLKALIERLSKTAEVMDVKLSAVVNDFLSDERLTELVDQSISELRTELDQLPTTIREKIKQTVEAS